MSRPRDREPEEDAEHAAHQVGFECWGEALTQDATGAAALTAHSEGMIACDACGTVWRDACDGEACARCDAILHSRKPYSIQRTWAFVIAACILYLPANLLPVMVTTTLIDEQRDTIMSGIIYFWVNGEWELAAVVFIASFLVPLFKLSAMILMLLSAQYGSTWRLLQRARLYRIVEFIGRWSMLDVFVVSLLAGLVQIQGFATITPGPGVAAFGSVVVLTMLASISFDPRLAWDHLQKDSEIMEMESDCYE
ncbi:MAG: Paraquat-inducible protein [Herbaspirillum sp.]|jgi:paraquat-inducible protein A|nr:Paraquat-inducible protein [Herbaspirillum sp.]